MHHEVQMAETTHGAIVRLVTNYVGMGKGMTRAKEIGNRHAKSAHFLQANLPSDCRICPEMCGSGHQVNTAVIIQVPETVQPVSIVEVAGTMTIPPTFVPPIATGTSRRIATTTSDFAAPARHAR